MKKLRFLLLLQALSPIAVLMFFKTLPFENILKNGIEKTAQENILLTVFICLLLLWLVVVVFCRMYFSSFGKMELDEKNRTAKKIEEDKESSLDFFMTFLLPLVIDDVDKINGFCVFWVSLIMVILLLRKTSLFYRNPVLAAFGYRMFWLEIEGTRKLGISTTIVENNELKINYTSLSEDVIFFKKV